MGKTTTWDSVAQLMVKYGKSLEIRYVSFDRLRDLIQQREAGDGDVIAAQYAGFSLTGGAVLPEEKVERQRNIYCLNQRV
jgi:hypothetical protein